MTTVYQIKVKGQLDPQFTAWLGNFVSAHTPDGDTLLTGTVVDEAALYGILARCRDLGLTLISINPLPKFKRGTTMNWIHVEAAHIIDARPEAVYAVVSDYHVGHAAIVPKPYFTPLIVEKGGKGEGTVLRGSVKVFGNEYPFHQLVTEPEPGRVLVETDIDTGQWTRWTFEAQNGGKATRVTITSDFPPSAGIVGWLERFTKPAITRNIYNQELRNLAEYVRANSAN